MLKAVEGGCGGGGSLRHQEWEGGGAAVLGRAATKRGMVCCGNEASGRVSWSQIELGTGNEERNGVWW